jgi:hypothetical protein
MSEVSRRKFIIGGSAVAAVAAIATSTSLIGEDSKQTSLIAKPTSTPEPRIDPAVDPASWFDSPADIAILGAAPLGATIRGSSEQPSVLSIKSLEEYVAVVELEQQAGTLQQLGNWFLTPTEVAVAQRISKTSV